MPHQQVRASADRVCGKRLKALIPMLVDAMERHGHLDLDPVIKVKVLQVSAAAIDRMLAAARLHIDGQRRRRKGVGTAIRRSIPVRTFADWRVMSQSVFDDCKGHGLEQTRSRAYKKNDQAWVEQKNGAVACPPSDIVAFIRLAIPRIEIARLSDPSAAPFFGRQEAVP